MLGRLLALAILAIAAYYVITEGWPRLREHLEARGSFTAGSGAEADESRLCVAAASAARDTVTAELLPTARPPVDPAVWSTIAVRVAQALAEADRACFCTSLACAKSSEAVGELRRLFDMFDEMARGDAVGIANPATRLERVDGLLEEARLAAASG